MIFNLDNRHFFQQTTRGSSSSILKFKPFGSCSMTFCFDELLIVATVLNYNVYTLGSCSRLFCLSFIFFPPKKLWISYGISYSGSYFTKLHYFLYFSAIFSILSLNEIVETLMQFHNSNHL